MNLDLIPFYFLLLFLFVSHYQDSFPKTQSLVLLCISSWDSDCCVFRFATECLHMDKCVLFVFILWFLR